jgi:hypothetical protein
MRFWGASQEWQSVFPSCWDTRFYDEQKSATILRAADGCRRQILREEMTVGYAILIL